MKMASQPKSKKSDPTPKLTPQRKALLLAVTYDQLGLDMPWVITQLKHLARTPSFAGQVRFNAIKQLERLRREALDALERYTPMPTAPAHHPERIGRKYPPA